MSGLTMTDADLEKLLGGGQHHIISEFGGGTSERTPQEKEIAKARKAAQRDSLRSAFEQLWRALGGPELQEEYYFHPTRKWRADYFCPPDLCIELEGGVWSGGRHTRGKGFLNDVDKYNAMRECGYRLARLATGQITVENVQRIIDSIAEEA